MTTKQATLGELEEIFQTYIADIVRSDLADDLWFKSWDEMKDYWEQISQAHTKKKGEIPDWRDQDHIHAHYLQNRDIFLTWDKAILSLAEDLKDKFGIIIVTPETYLSAG